MLHTDYYSYYYRNEMTLSVTVHCQTSSQNTTTHTHTHTGYAPDLLTKTMQVSKCLEKSEYQTSSNRA